MVNTVVNEHADQLGWIMVDGNEAAATVAHRLSEVIAIYPITPSSPMGELADAWSSKGRRNLWGGVPEVIEMQSEGGAAGALHGALQTGALATTFTASQGLLLMLPDMFKIAGELTPFVMHVAARTVATHALSIFGDHSDVMAARTTGFAMLCSSSVQEAQDLALVAHAATLKTRVPFLHFFDGFRTSHEVAKIRPLSDEDLASMVDLGTVRAHRARALSPEHPVLRGSAQNPDVFFQAREAASPFHRAVPDAVQAEMDALAARTGRRYRLFDYLGHPEAEHVLVAMGSACGAASEAVDALVARGRRVGLVSVGCSVRSRYRRSWPPCLRRSPRSRSSTGPRSRGLRASRSSKTSSPPSWRRRRRPGRPALARHPRVIGCRYGLASKEFTPAMASAIFDELALETPRRDLTVGIADDVSGTSLDVDRPSRRRIPTRSAPSSTAWEATEP